MNKRKFFKIVNHYNKYFEQEAQDMLEFDGNIDESMPIDVIVYKPTQKYPFWKLATVGASDYKMPKHKSAIARRNEYVMFLDKYIDISPESKEYDWYYKFLMLTAYAPRDLEEFISYAHTIELNDSDNDDNNQESNKLPISLLLMPEVIEDVRILKCKLGLFEKCACLQVMPITKEEYELGLKKIEEKIYGKNHEPNSFLARKIEK